MYGGKTFCFEGLLKKDNYVFIHYRSIQVIAEMYKVIGNVQSPEIFNEIIQLRKRPLYNLCYTSRSANQSIGSVCNDKGSVSYIDFKIWKPIQWNIFAHLFSVHTVWPHQKIGCYNYSTLGITTTNSGKHQRICHNL